MRPPRLLTLLFGLASLSLSSASKAITPIHEAGRCAIRGNCGKSSFFSPELPCPDNGLAEEPEDDVRKQLVGICGAKWETGKVCCAAEQVCCPTKMGWVNCTDTVLCSSTRSPKTSKKPTPSYPPAPPAKKTSTTFSAPSPAPPRNRSS